MCPYLTVDRLGMAPLPTPNASRAGIQNRRKTMRQFATHFLALLAASVLSGVTLGVALV